MGSRSGIGRIKTNLRKVKPGPDQAFTLPKGTSAAPIMQVKTKIKSDKKVGNIIKGLKQRKAYEQDQKDWRIQAAKQHGHDAVKLKTHIKITQEPIIKGKKIKWKKLPLSTGVKKLKTFLGY
tara:strand:+ start:349 stop:714 length:366 start_codon:yes stop_codon:yes gene_type:complete